MARERMTSKAPESRQRKSRLMAEPAVIMMPRLLFILSTACLVVFGLVMVYSASSIAAYNEFGDAAYYVKRQAVFVAVGIILCVVMSRIPYSLWRSKALVLVLWCFTVVLLALTAFGLGVSALGAERSIVIAGFALQPAEFAKITVLMTVAAIVQMRLDGEIGSRQFIAYVLGATIIPLILIYRQPDLGTAIILAIGIIALALLAGISMKIIFAILGIVIAYVVIACITQPYHLDRIAMMFDPWVDPQGNGYQAIQSLYAFGNGGVFGTGLGLSRQKYLYLPYAHTDFIFAIVGEELGLLGSISVVVLFGLFIFAGMRISRNAPDLFGCMISGSFTVMIGFQACVNMACVTGIAPVTGKALPLISYGGSSMVATMIMIGIILSVSFRSKVGMTYERKRDNLRVIDGGRSEHDERRSQGRRSGNVVSFREVSTRDSFTRASRSLRKTETSSRASRPSSSRASVTSSSRASASSSSRASEASRGIPRASQGYAALKRRRNARRA